MNDILKTIAGGGQTWAHRMRMLRQVFRIAFTASLIVSSSFFCFKMFQEPKHKFQAIYYYVKGAFLGVISDRVMVSSNFLSSATGSDHTGTSSYVSAKNLENLCEYGILTLWKSAKRELLFSSYIGIFAFFTFLLFFFLRGIHGSKKRHLSGNQIKKSLIYIPRPWKNHPLRLGKAILNPESETSHMLISGGTGSGKTNAFHHLLPQIRKKGHKGIIIDLTGEFITRYYQKEKDFILNPFDNRGESWHPWAECKTPFDIEALAKCFIPTLGTEYDSYWKEAASTVFASLLDKYQEEQDLEQVVELLLRSPLIKLADVLEGTEGGAHIDPAGEKTAASIRSVATNHLKSLKYLEKTDNPFSIRDWVQQETQDSWLFLSALPSQRASLIPLLSAWYGSAIRSLMEMPINSERRLWFINDELPAMQKINGLERCLTEGRKYGACALLAIQSPAQIEAIYGNHSAKTIMANCSTKLVFAEQDPIIAKKLSESFGEKEVQENQEGLSYGAHEMRDGVTQSFITRMRPVISPTDIQNLKRNEGYLKRPGKSSIEKVKLNYVNFSQKSN